MDERREFDPVQLEVAAAAIVGQIVFVLTRLEFNIGLYLRNAVGGQDPEAVNPLIERLSFKGKLDALRDVIERKFESNDLCRADFKEWLAAVDAYRAKRNSFVHGRWGIDHRRQSVINVTGGLPNAKAQSERRFSIDELTAQVTLAKKLAVEFSELSDRWPV